MRNLSDYTRISVHATDGTTHTVPSGVAGYVVIDASAEIPAGAIVAILIGTAVASTTVGVREVGSSKDGTASPSGNTFIVGLTAGRTFEALRDALIDINYRVVGYIV